MPGQHGEGCGCQDESQFLMGSEFLYGYIDKEGVRALNELVQGSAKHTIRPYADRLDDSKSCQSEEDDPELIIHIPFTSPCKVQSIHLIGGDNGKHPHTVHIHANRDDIDFTNVADTEPIQSVELVEDFHGAIDYPLKVSKLQNVSSLNLHFKGNGSSIEIFYIGIRGTGSNYQRRAVNTVYEARASMSDHKTKDVETPKMGL